MEFSQVLYMCRQTVYIYVQANCIKEIECVKHIEVLLGSIGSIGLGIIGGGRTKVIPDVADQETIAGRSTGFEISVSRRWTLPIASPSCTSDAFWGSQGKSVHCGDKQRCFPVSVSQYPCLCFCYNKTLSSLVTMSMRHPDYPSKPCVRAKIPNKN